MKHEIRMEVQIRLFKNSDGWIVLFNGKSLSKMPTSIPMVEAPQLLSKLLPAIPIVEKKICADDDT